MGLTGTPNQTLVYGCRQFINLPHFPYKPLGQHSLLETNTGKLQLKQVGEQVIRSWGGGGLLIRHNYYL